MSGADARPSETELIARYFAPLASDPAAFRLGDDAACLTPPAGCDLVLTKDMLADRVHFLPEDAPAAVARKALRVNLSDLAAKGARPLGYLLGLGLPEGWTAAWLADFAAGLAADQAEYGIALYGGDTIASPDRLVLSVTAIGAVPAGTMVRRGGARPGDVVCVTGTIGDSALGVRLRYEPDLADRLALAPAHRAHLLDRYLLPRPRSVLAEAVRLHARAGMDISDGLVGDLAKMAEVSGVAIVIEADAVPLSAAASTMIAADPAFLRTAFTGGDDYELALAVPADRVVSLVDAARTLGVPVTPVGEVRAGAGVTVRTAAGRPMDVAGGSFSHF